VPRANAPTTTASFVLLLAALSSRAIFVR
jgi:hypothetical protein